MKGNMPAVIYSMFFLKLVQVLDDSSYDILFITGSGELGLIQIVTKMN